MTTSHPKMPLYTQDSQVGILLVNLGSPDTPSSWSVAKYLRSFLSDRRVVQIPKPLWLPILYGLILPFRSPSSAKKYRRIWQEDAPLRLHTQALTTKLAQWIKSHPFQNQPSSQKIHIDYAMRYGSPSIFEKLNALKALGCKKLLILPLFPQFSAVTTASVFDEVARYMRTQPYLPQLHFLNTYHDHPAYIQAIAQSIRNYWATEKKSEHLLFSFHGIPQAQWRKGDPYHCFCQKTARLVAEQLGLCESQYTVCFQSRLGKAKWLTPYTEKVLENLSQKGITSIDVVAPSFLADCLETIDEIALEYAELFHSFGQGSLRYIPALNSSDEACRMFYTMIGDNLYTASGTCDKLKEVDYGKINNAETPAQHLDI